MFEYLVKDIPVEDKGTIFYLFGQCNFNYKIYLRDFGYDCPIVTIVEQWSNPNRINDWMPSWVGLALEGHKFKCKEIMHLICIITGLDELGESYAEIKGDRWINDYYVYSLNTKRPFIPVYNYKSRPVQSNYYKYKQYIYQLLEIYNIKKESE
jgi:hypothetical protein